MGGGISMSNGRIERWITTDEGNHLPIIGGKIAPSDTRSLESHFLEGLTGEKPEAKENGKLSNKKSLIEFVKKQTNVDLSKYAEPRTASKRGFFGVHLDDMPKNDKTAVLDVLRKYGKNLRIESNGGYGDAIYYEK